MERRCLWIYGKPGLGKSRVAHNLFQNAYWKNGNKWWDGYRGEPTVVLDDLNTPALFSFLQRWADRYKVIGEVKGSSIGLTYKQFVVTSNFTPQRLGEKDLSIDPVTVQAIERRFLCVQALRWEDSIQDLIVQITNCYGKTEGYEQLEPVPLSQVLVQVGWEFDQTSLK